MNTLLIESKLTCSYFELQDGNFQISYNVDLRQDFKFLGHKMAWQQL